MRTAHVLTTALLAGAALFGTAGAALADDPSASPSGSGEGTAAPTEAGTGFRTATAIKQDQRATADASTGDYLYWVFPADAGQRATVRTKITLPESAGRHGTSTWQLDVYDGLRRRQACVYGMRTRAAAKEAASVELSCTLRTVRSWAEPWDNDPLPGSYYVRLTVVGIPEEDLGQPVRAEVEATSTDAGGAQAGDGSLAAPLVPGKVQTANDTENAPEQAAVIGEPDGGWSSGWWSDRWIWTAAGGLLGALAGIAGYSLTRGSGRSPRVPPAS
ncbi:hypothetical protein HRW23_07970 [Streptomyces lunaelactis]|uniref:hypothetical protein n=1 Tax=Streptomyces lunaelactis TaxID=1535768 RepID=UPI001584EC8E|nr:hypothetical protein [Streptomyces lunaelactis]NUK00883.1 hypothetical protein [Streptomyces lunaelactis]NUK07415.1 hypothetical protein [Streptomyces lunaelactis]NUK14760.1 hypothetical protein [Streptomyces lunaelactis]NUK38529.1 hypothetical protein [Streptomyces lunaelactis]NUK40120.1 hypothetical protein [Streptomyces lunaelactis]